MGRGCTPADVLEALYYLVQPAVRDGPGPAGHRRPGDAQLIDVRRAVRTARQPHSPAPYQEPTREPTSFRRIGPASDTARHPVRGPGRAHPRSGQACRSCPARHRSWPGSRRSASASRIRSCSAPSRRIRARARCWPVISRDRAGGDPQLRSRASCPPYLATRWSAASSGSARRCGATGSVSDAWSRPTTATCRPQRPTPPSAMTSRVACRSTSSWTSG